MATTTTEKPILFSTEMVQAILDGRKTQTRRVIKPQPDETRAKGKPVRKIADYFTGVPENGQAYYWHENGCWNSSEPFKCPYRADELWVRETWQALQHGSYKPFDCKPSEIKKQFADLRYKAEEGEVEYPWKPSIHMPRGASRIQLTVDDIRVERVQEITGMDAFAEGMGDELPISSNGPILRENYRNDFAELWDSINADRDEGQYSWENNPWVWVVEFSIKNIKE